MDTIEKAAAKLSKIGLKNTQIGNSLDSAPPPLSTEKIIESEKIRVPLAQRLEENGFLFPECTDIQRMEEYRRIKRPLLMKVDANKQDKANLIMVTSSLPGEGKTFTSINLAISIAMELDRTVLFVDADVHKPAASTTLGIIDYNGLTDVLVSNNKIKLPNVILKTDISKVSLLAVGQDRSNANELLASSKMSDLVKELTERYEDRIIIVDTPPILATNEASILANLAGQILLVVEAERTPQSILSEALSNLNITDETNIGLVLNKARFNSKKSGYYYESYRASS